VLEGYAYQGAFFSPHHFAELKQMYDKQLLAYEAACKKLPIVSKNTRRGGPPRDLPTLKTFLEAGKKSKKRKQNIRERNELQKVVRSVAKEILALMKKEKKRGEGGHRLAPKGVILYFEGLDCSGKSSTGGLVQAALEQSGYDVGMRQYNRPPTAEQRMRPWMDRFDVPGSSSILDLSEKQDEDGEHIGLVWDRGPAGDFVYGNLNELSPEEKKKRYEEFMDFDRECREKDILFLKLFFVTNRDSIAKTLGKRLAQKKMARDLTTWLQACRSRGEVEDVSFEGLEAISAHIDPTDFVAFNQYERNLRIFSNFVMNTDNDDNPWVVVNTGDRYAARKALMSSFRDHLHQFQSRGQRCSPCLGPKPSVSSAKTQAIDMDEMMKKKFKSSWRHSMIAWVSLLALLVLANTYFTNTNWDRAWIVGPTKYNISALLEGGNDDDFVNGDVDDVQNNNGDGKGKEAKAAKTQNVDEGSDKEGKNKNVPTIDAEDDIGNAKAAKIRV
jgi:polyphosphate kinase 2 (PPK2 family)